MSVERYVREQFGGDPWRAVRWLRNTLAMRVREVDSLEAKCERLERIRDFVASDGLAVSFQSMGQYRTEILRQFRAALAEGREP